MIRITRNISIHEDELDEQFIRASGPGGQNVNKVATAVQLRFDVAHSPNLPAAVKSRIQKLAGSRMTSDGVLIIESQAERSQAQNRQQALDKLTALIRRAAPPPKRRKRTRPTAASRRKRLEKKRRRAEKKRMRRPPDW